jgi:anthranilate/para-aminobenzoate synthase component I
MKPPVSACAVRELRCDWQRVVAGLAARPGFWWLDSALVDARLGRFSFAGAEPWGVLRVSGSRALSEQGRARWEGETPGQQRSFEDPLDALRGWMTPPLSAEGPPAPVPFVGGAVVALSYELAAPAPPGTHARLPELTASSALLKPFHQVASTTAFFSAVFSVAAIHVSGSAVCGRW